MSQLLDNTKKLTKNRKKKFEKLLIQIMIQIMSQLLDYTKKMAKNRGKNSKYIFCSDLSETNNDPTFDYTKKDKIEKKYRKLFLAQICMKQEMSQFLDNTKKIQKIENY